MIVQLEPPESCENGFNFCGGDISKYPVEDIAFILNNTDELQNSPETLNRFFRPNLKLRSGFEDEIIIDDIPLNDCACPAQKQLVPQWTRAKNVNNKWVFLAQMMDLIQEVEVTICENPGTKCVNDIDSPHGEDSTLCRQIFGTQKLLALDEDGNVNVDTFDLPSACVCKTKIREFSFRKDNPEDVPFVPLPLINPDRMCSEDNEATKPIKHDIFERGNANSVKDGPKQLVALELASTSVTPCESGPDNDTLCDTEDSEYPEKAINFLLFRNRFFANKEYFNTVLGPPCEPPEPEKLMTRLGFDLTEAALCATRETYVFPKKAKNSRGVWKYVVNTLEYQQGISMHKCHMRASGQSCRYAGELGENPEVTECRQMYTKHSLLAVTEDGMLSYDTFEIPSACVCHIKEPEFFLFQF